MKYFWIFLLIPVLCYGAQGDVASIGGKAVTAVSSVMGKAGTAIASMCGKSYSDGDSVACSAASYSPTVDTNTGTWTPSTGSDLYAVLNELISAGDTADYVYAQDNAAGTDIIRFTLPGDCNVTTVRVRLYAEDQSASVCTVDIDISPDNSTWTSTQTYNMPDTAGEVYKDYSVTWTTPAYVYVRIDPSSATYDQILIYSVEVRVNP